VTPPAATQFPRGLETVIGGQPHCTGIAGLEQGEMRGARGNDEVLVAVSSGQNIQSAARQQRITEPVWQPHAQHRFASPPPRQ
jgi:hypothetical protein